MYNYTCNVFCKMLFPMKVYCLQLIVSHNISGIIWLYFQSTNKNIHPGI